MSYEYLASPYTHLDGEVVERRYRRVMHFSSLLYNMRRPHYSPILHCHPLTLQYDLPGDHTFWEDMNYAMLSRAHGMTIADIDGWKQSKGVQQEIGWARELSIPISLFDGVSFHNFE